MFSSQSVANRAITLYPDLVIQISKGKLSGQEQLEARRWRNPEVQTLLDRVRPGWRWEPMLLEQEGERVRVYTGLAMRIRLIQILGPARALRVAQLVARFGGPVLGVDWGRRRLLQQGGALAGLALPGE